MKRVEVPEGFNFPKIGLAFLRGCRDLIKHSGGAPTCLPAGRESDPDLANFLSKFSRVCVTLPMSFLVGEPGIGPGPHAPKACILPVYYSPTRKLIQRT